MSGAYLGISSHFHDSAAALVVDGQIVAAVQEERFTRKKADHRWPKHSIDYCLRQLPKNTAIDALAYYENPALKTRRILENAQSSFPSGALLWPRMITTLQELSVDIPKKLRGLADEVFFIPHHRSHAASAFYPSPCQTAAILVVDGVGEYSTTTIWKGDDSGLTAQAEIAFPHSLGLFYSAFTQYCGFKVNSGEYKLMGLAPFGVPRYTQLIRDELIDLNEDGSFALNMSYFDFHRRQSTTSPLFENLFGQPQRHPDDPISIFHMNVAASAQQVLEQAVVSLGRSALDLTGQRNLCLAGGVALNCLANRRLRLELPELETLWIQPAAGDAGGALGAALELSATRLPAKRRPSARPDNMRQALLGPSFTDAQIQNALERAGLHYQHEPDPQHYAERVAKALAEQKIIGHFDGAMEFGPRALGNRSILADPRGEQTLQKVNRSIKFREDWRPFAPIVLADKAKEIFEPGFDSPYMLLVADLKPSLRGETELATARAMGLSTPMELQTAVNSQYSAVSHVDHSARLQTISADDGRRVARILRLFDELSGCPLLLNTSFNVRGEPIVCTPTDAINGFLNTHLDVLAIGSFLVFREQQEAQIKRLIGKRKYDAD